MCNFVSQDVGLFHIVFHCLQFSLIGHGNASRKFDAINQYLNIHRTNHAFSDLKLLSENDTESPTYAQESVSNHKLNKQLILPQDIEKVIRVLRSHNRSQNKQN